MHWTKCSPIKAFSWLMNLPVGYLNSGNDTNPMGRYVYVSTPNRAIKCEHYTIPTPNSVTDNLSNQTGYIVVDTKSGYWHVYAWDTTGRYMYTRMPFDIKSAQAVFFK